MHRRAHSFPQRQVRLLHTPLLYPAHFLLHKNSNQVHLGPFQGWGFFQQFRQYGEIPFKIHMQWLNKWAPAMGFWGNCSGISPVCALFASPGLEALTRAEVSTGRFVQFCCTVLCQRCPRLDFTKLLFLKGSWTLCLTSRGISLTGLQCLCSLGGVEQFGGKCGF